jgi:uncharacterized membrane-anchored protein
MTGGPFFGWHADRDRLLAEAHARPSTPLEAPVVAIRVANVSGQEAADADRGHMADLCRTFGAQAPDRRARWWALDGPGWSLRWERHTEFSSWTFFCPPPTAVDPRGPLERLPSDWLQQFPNDVLVATMLELRRDYTGDRSPPLASDGVMIGAEVLEGAARVFTDFRADDSGMTRFRVMLRSNDAALAGRLALILLEIETYRLMALLAFPLAGEATVQLRAIEAEAGVLASRLAAEEGVEADRTLLSRLITLSGEAEGLSARTTFRFGGSNAYHDLVRDRVASLREEKIAGVQTIAEFMERRLAPAMRTCNSVAERERAVIARIARAGAMLDTRIKVADEATSAELLSSMNARADASLRLQRTVEGLSVAAISYYALMLLSYPVKALEHVQHGFDATMALGVAAPVIAVLVWLSLRAVRRRIEGH